MHNHKNLLCIKDDDTFIIDNEYKYVFCYGVESDDCLSLDKQKIYQLYHSAIQQLDRDNIELKKDNIELKQENIELKKDNIELKQENKEIKSELEKQKNEIDLLKEQMNMVTSIRQ